ncbi:WD40 repeat-like protein [Suillus weaverae]|nr:WD40 repeat-like protein [Suillus weaverae]
MYPLTSDTTAIAPRKTMRGHTHQVRGVLHLPGGQRIITCSEDGSLRLWDLESGAQIGDDWRDEGEQAAVFTIALSPNGDCVASGNDDGKVRLWDVETGKVIARWTGHTDWVRSVCWSADGRRVVSGSDDGIARVWDVRSAETVLTIKTGSQWVLTVIYSPNSTKIATGIHNESGIKIWDSKTGELLATLKHDYQVWSVVSWTSDGKRLVSASYGSIRIFDTATWRRIAILEGGTFDVHTLCLSRNGRLLASASDDQTVRLWNLNKSIPVGPPLQHEGNIRCAAFSADGKLLVTGCDNNMQVWDICGILKQGGFEDLLSLPNVVAGSSLKNSNAARRPTQLKDSYRGPPGFFDDAPHVHLRRAISITVPLRAAVVLSQPLLGVELRSSAAFHRSFVVLTPTPAKQPNSSNTQDKASSLVAVLLLSKFLQYRTGSRWLSLRGQGTEHSSCAVTRKHRRRHR